MDDKRLNNIWSYLTEENLTSSDFDTWKKNFIESEEIQGNIHSHLVSKKLTSSDMNTWKKNLGFFLPQNESEDLVSTTEEVTTTVASEEAPMPQPSASLDSQTSEIISQSQVPGSVTQVIEQIEEVDGQPQIVKNFILTKEAKLSDAIRNNRFEDPITGTVFETGIPETYSENHPIYKRALQKAENDLLNQVFDEDEDMFGKEGDLSPDKTLSNLYREKRNKEFEIQQVQNRIDIIPEGNPDLKKFEDIKNSLTGELNDINKRFDEASSERAKMDNTGQVYNPYTGEDIAKIDAPVEIVQDETNVSNQAENIAKTKTNEQIEESLIDIRFQILNQGKKVSDNMQDVLDGMITTELMFFGDQTESGLKNLPQVEDERLRKKPLKIYSENIEAKKYNRLIDQYHALDRALRLNVDPTQIKTKGGSIVDLKSPTKSPFFDFKQSPDGFFEFGLISGFAGEEPAREGWGTTKMKAADFIDGLEAAGFVNIPEETKKRVEKTFFEEASEFGGNLTSMVAELSIGRGALKGVGVLGKGRTAVRFKKGLEALGASTKNKYIKGGLKILGSGVDEALVFATTGALTGKEEAYDPIFGAALGAGGEVANLGLKFVSKLPIVNKISERLKDLPFYNTGAQVGESVLGAGTGTAVLYAAEIVDGIATEDKEFAEIVKDVAGDDPEEKAMLLFTTMLAGNMSKGFPQFFKNLRKDIGNIKNKKFESKLRDYVNKTKPKQPDAPLQIQEAILQINKNGTPGEKLEAQEFVDGVETAQSIEGVKKLAESIENKELKEVEQVELVDNISNQIVENPKITTTEIALSQPEIKSIITSSESGLKSLHNKIKKQFEDGVISAEEAKLARNSIQEVINIKKTRFATITNVDKQAEGIGIELDLIRVKKQISDLESQVLTADGTEKLLDPKKSELQSLEKQLEDFKNFREPELVAEVVPEEPELVAEVVPEPTEEVLVEGEKEEKPIQELKKPSEVEEVKVEEVEVTEPLTPKQQEKEKKILIKKIQKTIKSVVKPKVKDGRAKVKMSPEAQTKVYELESMLVGVDLNSMSYDQVAAIADGLSSIESKGIQTKKAVEKAERITSVKRKGEIAEGLYGDGPTKQKSTELNSKEDVEDFLKTTSDRIVIVDGNLISSISGFKQFVKDNPDISFSNSAGYETTTMSVARRQQPIPSKFKKGFMFVFDPTKSVANVRTQLMRVAKGSPTLKKPVKELLDRITEDAPYLVEKREKQLYNLYKKFLTENFNGSLKQTNKFLDKTVAGLDTKNRNRLLTNEQIVDLEIEKTIHALRAKENRRRAEKEKNEKEKKKLLDIAEKQENILKESQIDQVAFNEYVKNNPKIFKLAKSFLDFYAETSVIFKPIIEKVTGRPVIDKNYYPTGRVDIKEEKKPVSQLEIDELNSTNKFHNASAMTDRLKDKDLQSTAKLNIETNGARTKAVDYIQNMTHAEYYIDVSKMVNELFNSSTRGKIYEKIGPLNFKYLKENLDYIIDPKNTAYDRVANIISGFNRAGITMQLGFSLGNIPKQLTSFTHFAAVGAKDGISPADWVKGFYDVFSNKENREVAMDILKSDFVYDRFTKSNIDPDLKVEGQKALKGTRRQAWNFYQKVAMSPVTFGDMGGVLLGGIPFAVAKYNKVKKTAPGFKDKNAYEKAYKRFRTESNEAQQSSAEYTLSVAQRNQMMKLLLTYRTAQIQAFNKSMQGWINMTDKSNSFKERWSGFKNWGYWTSAGALFNLVSQGGLFLLANTVLNGDEKKTDKDIEQVTYDTLIGTFESYLQGMGGVNYIPQAIIHEIKGRPGEFSLPPVIGKAIQTGEFFRELKDLVPALIKGKEWDDLTDSEKKKITFMFGKLNKIVESARKEEPQGIIDIFLNRGKNYGDPSFQLLMDESAKELEELIMEREDKTKRITIDKRKPRVKRKTRVRRN